MIRSGRHRAVSRRAAPAKRAFTQERAVIDRPITTSAFFLPGITVGPALSRLPLTVARWKQRNDCVSRSGVTVVFSGPTQFGGRVVVEVQFPAREIEQSKSSDPQLPEPILQRSGQHPQSILHAPSEIDRGSLFTILGWAGYFTNAEAEVNTLGQHFIVEYKIVRVLKERQIH